MIKEYVFDMAKQNNATQIHARSAFIQGLILMNENEVPPFLSNAKPIVRKINELCDKYNISKIALAIHFIKQFDIISHLVLGVDNMEQLKENITIFRQDFPIEILRDIAKEFEDIDANIVMPSLWDKR